MGLPQDGNTPPGASDDLAESVKAPFSIQCTSTYGELFKISAVEFERKVLKDEDT